ncbi:MAG: cobalt ECF transporter T component CbiQ [Cloacibacillus porcorum]|uniref:cobalt ECF transporter T component CbiQ n=1 Tax=Cloacibacillus porcorum TaxID=1197717 RepID=UPI0023F327DF|nr:cobalt ECF transporter T component CbiQ [Cloacibacillus porcorum]MCD7876527.1 cobalt ECF transporter T component CbiQ [Cloacibacillus porcorum]
MTDLRGSVYEIYSLEQLAGGGSVIHALDPRAKIVGTLFYIAAVVSFGRGELSALAPFVLYPAVALALAGIPGSMIFKRSLVALPFCLFAGLSSAFFDRSVLFTVGGLHVTAGWMALFTIVFRTLLCVSAVLILVAVTPFRELTEGLRRLRLPAVFISLFEMTYRYLGTLAGEALSMYTAYSLRGGGKKGVAMRDMGSFAGQLLLRSFDRAERVYQAMKCRGYQSAPPSAIRKRRLVPGDLVFILLLCGSSLLFRLVNIPQLIGRLFECLI